MSIRLMFSVRGRQSLPLLGLSWRVSRGTRDRVQLIFVPLFFLLLAPNELPLLSLPKEFARESRDFGPPENDVSSFNIPMTRGKCIPAKNQELNAGRESIGPAVLIAAIEGRAG